MNVLLLTSVDAPHIEEPGDVRPVVEGFEEEAADDQGWGARRVPPGDEFVVGSRSVRA